MGPLLADLRPCFCPYSDKSCLVMCMKPSVGYCQRGLCCRDVLKNCSTHEATGCRCFWASGQIGRPCCQVC